MSKRELVDTGNDKRYVRRDEDGKFKESADVGKSRAADQRQPASKELPGAKATRAIVSADDGSE